MEYFAAIDVALERSSVCVVDGTGKIISEAKVASEPEARFCQRSCQQVSPVLSRSRWAVMQLPRYEALSRFSGGGATCGDQRGRVGYGGSEGGGNHEAHRGLGRSGQPMAGT